MDDGQGVRAGCIRIRCPSPRRIVARWFSPQGKVKEKKIAMARGRIRDCDSVRIRTFSEDDLPGLDHFSDSPPPLIHSELQRREFLFSMGVSCYLLHLIATGREEIHRILELRNDLEKFLKYREEELKRKHQEFVDLRNGIEKFLEYHNEELRRKQQEQTETSAYSTTSDVVDGPVSSTHHYYSPQTLETSMCIGGEGKMDQLEAELKAEFELLQFGQDQDGKSSKLKDVSDKSEDSEGLRLGQMCPGPVEEQQGVCPYELERRLHELMETRQEEEIKKLEIALEDAKQRLQMKETEASWWKDTAYIVSERIPEPSRITYNSRTYPYPLSR